MVDSSREAFERWAKREGKGGLARLVCWQAWQASRSAAIEECAAEIERFGNGHLCSVMADALRALKGEG